MSSAAAGSSCFMSPAGQGAGRGYWWAADRGEIETGITLKYPAVLGHTLGPYFGSN